ncbi:hypothetical protein [Streptomyces sp. bgisy031]|uniref:hypothetical protein n=1 Tax=Streptomyces sp. bgisy031 TaxID=3413772 RepID=UPI003D71C2CB
MTPDLRTARTCDALAAASTAGAIYLGWTYSLWAAAACAYVALFLAWCARAHHRHHRVRRARARLAERAARGMPIDPIVFTVIPCCDLSEHADGQAHDSDCLRHLAQESDPNRSSAA